jgi:CRP-like cAMP-binding protein
MHRHEDPLRQIPLFSGMSAKDLEHIHKIATSLTVTAGEVLMEEGAVSHEMVIVIDGTLEVTRHGEHIADVGKGGFAGEIGLLCHRPRNSKVTVKTDGEILHIDGRGFTALLEDVPQLAVKMLPIVAERASHAEHD